jgi:PAS domain S-box-containing protein
MVAKMHPHIDDAIVNVLNAVSSPVFVVDANSQVILTNSVFAQLTDFAPPNGVRPHLLDYVPIQDTSDDIRQLFDSNTHPIERFELMLPTAHGVTSTYAWCGRVLTTEPETLFVYTGTPISTDVPSEDTSPVPLHPPQQLYEHAAVGILMYTAAGIAYANPAFSGMLGYDAGHFLNMPRDTFIKYVERESSGVVLLFLENNRRGIDNSEDYLIPFRHQDGSTVWLHTYLSRLHDAESPALVVTCINVTHQMKTERVLRRNESLYRSVVRAIPDAIYVLDLDTMCVEFFDESFMGYSRDTLFAQDALLNIVHADDKDLVLRHWEMLFSMPGNAVHEVAYRVQHAAGHWEWVESRFVITERDTDNRPSEALFVLRVVTGQKQLKHRMRDSEQRYYDIFEHKGIMNLLVDPETNTIVDANRAAAAFYGYDKGDLRGMPLDIVQPKMPERFFNYVRTVLDNDSLEFGSIHHTLDGMRRDVKIYGSPTHYKGQPLVHLIITDYTEQHQIEEALRDSEARIMQLIQQNADAIVLVDTNGIIRFANKAAEVLFDRQTHVLIGTPFGAPIATGEVTLIDVMQNDGSVRSAEMRLVEIDWENERFTLASLRDMTERIRAEKALGASELRFRTVFDDAPMGIFVVDRRGYPVMVNRAFREMLGYDEDESFQIRFLDFTHPDDVGMSLSHFQEILQGQVMGYQIEKRYLRKDNSTLWARVNVSRFSLEESADAFVIAMIEDITSAQLMQQQSTRLQREKHRLDILSEFIRHISHEFRTPLSVITTCLYIINKTTNVTEPLKIQLHRITLQNQSIIQLVDDLVTVLRLEKGEPLNFGYTDINELIKQVRADLKHNLSDKEQQVELVFDNTLASPWLSPEDMRIAIRHLLSNASRHSDVGKTITIQVKNTLDMLTIAVIDEGEGIPSDRLPHIFDSFYRGDEARTERGFGLGLAIVRRVVESHGGYMNVKSEVNKGSTFTINVPLIKQRDRIALSGGSA